MVATLTIIPRQREMNRFGRIATVSYVIYFEEARISYLKECGADVEGKDYRLHVSAINCKFNKECGLDDHLYVETVIAHIRENGFTVMQQMKNRVTGELIANAETEMFYARNGELSASALPESFVRMLEIPSRNIENES